MPNRLSHIAPTAWLLLQLSLWTGIGGPSDGLLATFNNPNSNPDTSRSFGGSLAFVGVDKAIVGSALDSAGGLFAGAAYLFNTDGELLTTFTDPTSEFRGFFGGAVAAVGSDRVIIGAQGDNTGASETGAAYLFSVNGTLLTTFTNPAPWSKAYFGGAVAAVDGDMVLIGASDQNIDGIRAGAAYLFRSDGALLTTFTNPTPSNWEHFGGAVAVISSGTVVIGARDAYLEGNNAGEAYLFNTNGTLLTTFTSPAPAHLDCFGCVVAGVDAGRVLIGAYRDDTGAEDAGAAYLFNTNGTLLTTFTNPTPAVLDYFGGSLAVADEDTVLIGASLDDTTGTNAGAAYLFKTNGLLLTTFTNPALESGESFGGSIAGGSAGRVLIGAIGNDSSRGTAYLYDATPSAIYYVNINSPGPAVPYASWETAATNIQDAVDFASAEGLITVTNGVYATGGRSVFGGMTNRLVVDKPLSIQSVNGPEVTVIEGWRLPGTTNGDGAIRCVHLTDGAILRGFTLANGATWNSGDADFEQSGGGVWCESTNAIVSDCILTGNSAAYRGGAAYRGTLINCVAIRNTANDGGGACFSTLNNCTLVGNSASILGGGSFYGALNNCIAYLNSASDGVNYHNSIINFSCTMPLPPDGIGNISESPLFVDESSDNLRLAFESPCINVGRNVYVVLATDLDGESRIVGGIVDMGAYENPDGGSPERTRTHYVNADGTNATWPYASWTTAANVIQDALDAADSGDTVLVTNGVYALGGKAVHDTLTNRVAVDKPLTLISVNGPEVTIIRGNQVPGTVTGASAVRCAYLTNGALLSGFTLTGGATYSSSSVTLGQYGGGVYCESTNAWISNCVVTGNSASEGGGGVLHGTLDRCILASNSATVGAGAFASALNSCIVMDNVASLRGGGTMASTVNNCTVIRNASGIGGGSYYDQVKCSIVYFNSSSVFEPNQDGSTLNYCCTSPLPTNGVGNIMDAPMFVDLPSGNLRLQPSSPCINAGSNAYVDGSADLDGRPRIVGSAVDIGAYEFQGLDLAEYITWLQQYGLPTDGSADNADTDADLLNNWQEWKAWTDPTNQSSVLKVLNPQPEANGILISWESIAGQSYQLERATNAASPFSILQSNIVGESSTTSFVDTTATNGDAFLYRVAVPE